ncbi:MAG: Hsp70 family protein [Pirellulales bacterium]
MSELDALQAAFREVESRYIVGIDLGTTNSALAFVDMEAADRRVLPFEIEQSVDFSSRQRREVLPSFHYEPTADEQTALASSGVKQTDHVVGVLARESGARSPGRQVASAKSWLCHDGVDREAPLLPWHGDEGVTKLSPVEVSSRYLAHLRTAWDRAHPDYPLAEQDVVLTLPASFDEVARQLTIAAAKLAGLPRILLIEEPQAAFYWWLQRHRETWEQVVSAGQTILVCDIGGGTTDFTLIRVRQSSSTADASDRTTPSSVSSSSTLHADDERKLSLHRTAVGEHLILGGDNLDLAIAKFVEQRLPDGTRLSTRHWDALRASARAVKEVMLGDTPPERTAVPIPGSGSRIVGGQLRVECAREEIQHLILDGFFPHCPLKTRPAPQQSGFQEFGLPYASDAAATKHLAEFLWDHRTAGRDEALTDIAAAKPDWVLFNGGVMASPQIRTRLLDVITAWFAGQDPSIPGDWKPAVLDNPRLDLAVACGAAYFGLVRRGHGVRIEAKLARSYYLQISEQPPQAVCVIGGSASPGDKMRINSLPLELALGEPVQFPIVVSGTRLADKPGQIIDVTSEQFTSLPPIRTVLQQPGRRRSERLAVVLESELSEIGTLQLWCAERSGDRRWQLEFDVRSTTQTDRSAVMITGAASGVVEQSLKDQARAVLEHAFGADAAAKCPEVMKELAELTQLNKNKWPPSLLRSIWQDLIDLEAGRRRSPLHESRWLNLVGYCLRPGYGMAADDWRVSQTWRTVYGKLAFSAPTSRSESLILWRRVAGGFTAGQQLAVYQQIAGPLRNTLDPNKRTKAGTVVLQPAEVIEQLRLVGSLELLPKEEKHALGNRLLEIIDTKRWESARSAMLWTLGRLGNRVPTYGPLNTVVDAATVESWLEKLLRVVAGGGSQQLALMLCARRTGDRYRDIEPGLRSTVLSALADAPLHYRVLVEQGGDLAQDESSEIIGESLPLGLRPLS